MLTKKPTKKDDEQEGLSQKDIDFLSGPSSKIKPYGDVNFKLDKGMSDDLSDRSIQVNLIPESLFPGQGELQERFNDLYKDAVSDGSKGVEAQVTKVGLTTNNEKVAIVNYGTEEFLIPYESISSEIAELKKTSVGYKIGQLESESTPQGIDTSKYNK